MSLLYKNDVGVRLLISTNNPAIPGTAVLYVKLTKPSGVVTTREVDPADIDYVTGIITYTTVSGDLSEVGEYKVQVRGVFADGDDYKSDIDTFEVDEGISGQPMAFELNYMIS